MKADGGKGGCNSGRREGSYRHGDEESGARTSAGAEWKLTYFTDFQI